MPEAHLRSLDETVRRGSVFKSFQVKIINGAVSQARLAFILISVRPLLYFYNNPKHLPECNKNSGKNMLSSFPSLISTSFRLLQTCSTCWHHKLHPSCLFGNLFKSCKSYSLLSIRLFIKVAYRKMSWEITAVYSWMGILCTHKKKTPKKGGLLSWFILLFCHFVELQQ